MRNAHGKAGLELNVLIQRLLTLGLTLSTIALLAGMILSAFGGAPIPSNVLGFRHVPGGLRTGLPAGFASLGILLLIATPVLGVLGFLIHFAIKRDWCYVVAACLVLLVLMASAYVGIG